MFILIDDVPGAARLDRPHVEIVLFQEADHLAGSCDVLRCRLLEPAHTPVLGLRITRPSEPRRLFQMLVEPIPHLIQSDFFKTGEDTGKAESGSGVEYAHRDFRRRIDRRSSKSQIHGSHPPAHHLADAKEYHERSGPTFSFPITPARPPGVLYRD